MVGAGRGGGGGGEGETSLGDEQSLAGESQGAERVGGLMSKVLVFLTDREQMQTADRDRADRCPYVLIGTSQAGVRARWYLGPTLYGVWFPELPACTTAAHDPRAQHNKPCALSSHKGTGQFVQRRLPTRSPLCIVSTLQSAAMHPRIRVNRTDGCSRRHAVECASRSVHSNVARDQLLPLGEEHLTSGSRGPHYVILPWRQGQPALSRPNAD
ncbi:predicted protein [Histoplasma capsulatum G186AR]|uniref:Uncharacterized protein n=1 Tax=Ajellomyces capsulatus (strain G186AR / H82 / ATCC MYA-2454 / RMSCC 2432) TaxID=447093 RepID=C0NQL7_AJECG|nr:uncharacterized protein HCBG_05297 [Histoplasma capsulatum G186AR]EEH05981.1 predicted protein [Histoplasma capsulatum G186AR]